MFLKGTILKFTCDNQRPRIAKTIGKRNNELGQSDCGPGRGKKGGREPGSRLLYV